MGKPYNHVPALRMRYGLTEYNSRKFARTLKRNARDAYLSARGSFFHKPQVQNLYLASVQKTGSQWLSAVLSDPEINSLTSLKPYPQRRYEYDEFKRTFPRGVYVPGLYISYDLYEEIIKPTSYRTVYVMRDPRDIVVSWYWSMKETHTIMGKVSKYRAALNELNFDEGLHYCIDAFNMKFACMRSWANNLSDPNVLPVRLEASRSDPVGFVQIILRHIDINCDRILLSRILENYTIQKMRAKDLEKRSAGEESHYRRTPSSHREVFSLKHQQHFREVNGNLLEVLGYEE